MDEKGILFSVQYNQQSSLRAHNLTLYGSLITFPISLWKVCKAFCVITRVFPGVKNKLFTALAHNIRRNVGICSTKSSSDDQLIRHRAC